MTWLIDNSGLTWPEQAHPIAQWDAECDPVGYAVSDRGFIHLRQLNGGMRVHFNPSRVGRKTMISAFYVIVGEQPKRIALSYGRECPDLEIFGTVAAAFYRIEELLETHASVTPVVSQRRLSFDYLPKDITERIAELMHVWSNTQVRWSPERRANLSTAVRLEDVMIAHNPRGTDRLLFDHWGAGFDFHGPKWAQIARGREVEDHPLPKLGKWVAASFRQALVEGEPRLYSVGLALSNASRAIFSRRETALMLPWSDRDDDRYVTLIRFEKKLPSA